MARGQAPLRARPRRLCDRRSRGATMNPWPRRIRDVLAAHRPPMPPAELWHSRRRALAQSALLVRAFYLCLFFNQLQLYPNWNYWLGLRDMRLLWPLAWFAWTGTRAGVAIVVITGTGSALLAASIPTSR